MLKIFSWLKCSSWQSHQAPCETVQFYVFQGSKKEREGRSVKAWTNIKKKVRKPHDAVFTLRIYKTSFLLITKCIQKFCWEWQTSILWTWGRKGQISRGGGPGLIKTINACSIYVQFRTHMCLCVLILDQLRTWIVWSWSGLLFRTLCIMSL